MKREFTRSDNEETTLIGKAHRLQDALEERALAQARRAAAPCERALARLAHRLHLSPGEAGALLLAVFTLTHALLVLLLAPLGAGLLLRFDATPYRWLAAVAASALSILAARRLERVQENAAGNPRHSNPPKRIL